MGHHDKHTPSQQEMISQFSSGLKTGVGKTIPHESAQHHVTGSATYVDDRLEFPNQLHLYALMSPHAHANIVSIDTSSCLRPGVECVITADDIPGSLDIGAVLPGDPLLAKDTVEYLGQAVIAVAATSLSLAREAALAANIEYQVLDAIIDIEDALAKKHFVQESHQHSIGNADTGLAGAAHTLTGQLHIGGQEHFYLETQVASVMPTDDGGMIVYSSTQNPTEVQKLVSEVLGIAMNKVVVDMRRMGGGFGGKETQSAGLACLCAVVAAKTGRPTKMRLPRFEDMNMTGKRHPFFSQYTVGFNSKGVIQGITIDLAGNCGYSPDLSGAIVDRAMFHADNAYFLGNARITGHRCKTHLASNTAFRGFGGPQGMVTIENIVDHIARFLGEDPLTIRKRNFYGKDERNITHYHQVVEDNLLDEMIEELEMTSDYQQRRRKINEFNRDNTLLKKGIALTPVKFGISFTSSFLNQAGALLHIYTDGSIQLNHGGTEMGQGLNTKVAQIVAEVLQVDIERIQITATNTGKVPNTSPTAASSGTDLNGKAAEAAAQIIKQRLIEFASTHFGCSEQSILFKNNIIKAGNQVISFDDLIALAYVGQVSLSSTGYYKTPKIFYDREQAAGHPFYYFAYGAACSEVIIDTLTGEYRVLRTDILHDVGASLNAAIDIGQVEGGFIQGMGWLTTEELVWNNEGKLMTNGPASYKIPAIADTPPIFNVTLVENRKNPEDTVFHSKAVGEPPFMLGISVWCAIKDAVASLSNYKIHPNIDSPATPERVLMGIEQMKQAVNKLPEAEAING